MPLARTQAVLKCMLPSIVFEQLYRVAVVGFDLQQAVRDWVYYRTPKKTFGEKVMVAAIKSVLPYTMVGRGGLIATYKVAAIVEKEEIEGCFVECGIARGGSAALMLFASLLNRSAHKEKREAWLFDSFEGLPEPTEEDGFLRKPRGKDKASWDLAKGYCLGTQGEVEYLLFGKFACSRDKVHLVKGWFKDTLPRYREQVGDIAVLRVDGDWYESTECCMENLYDNVVPGGFVILDDYGLEGCKKAVDRFFMYTEVKPDIILDGRGGGYFRK